MGVTIACIGSGNMGSALMRGAAKYGGAVIGFTDTDRAKAEALADSLGASVYASNIEAVKKADYVFLAVKPQVLPGVLAEIAPAVRDRLASGKPAVLVSMAVGWSIGKILAILGGAGTDVPADHAPVASIPVVRIMPNTPALISKGIIAVAVSEEVQAEQAAELERILGAAGIVDYLEEGYMDAATGLSGSGPAFVYMFMEALADGGVLAGLPREKALRYAAQTVLGAAAMVQETGKHPGELKDMVASPGGTTIKGIAVLEEAGFRGTVIAAVEAAYRRSIELVSPIIGEKI
ncbi:MAG: pyrroline-5-carboxylate reductase [Treponema sp.]|jgi:pyrroline-5-carboxylate reductase|nr:pyrroline-5-carboxylate reductase [Treponema sp.]